jgi:hypothetical protein
MRAAEGTRWKGVDNSELTTPITVFSIAATGVRETAQQREGGARVKVDVVFRQHAGWWMLLFCNFVEIPEPTVAVSRH